MIMAEGKNLVGEMMQRRRDHIADLASLVHVTFLDTFNDRADGVECEQWLSALEFNRQRPTARFEYPSNDCLNEREREVEFPLESALSGHLAVWAAMVTTKGDNDDM